MSQLDKDKRSYKKVLPPSDSGYDHFTLIEAYGGWGDSTLDYVSVSWVCNSCAAMEQEKLSFWQRIKHGFKAFKNKHYTSGTDFYNKEDFDLFVNSLTEARKTVWP